MRKSQLPIFCANLLQNFEQTVTVKERVKLIWQWCRSFPSGKINRRRVIQVMSVRPSFVNYSKHEEKHQKAARRPAVIYGCYCCVSLTSLSLRLNTYSQKIPFCSRATVHFECVSQHHPEKLVRNGYNKRVSERAQRRNSEKTARLNEESGPRGTFAVTNMECWSVYGNSRCAALQSAAAHKSYRYEGRDMAALQLPLLAFYVHLRYVWKN